MRCSSCHTYIPEGLSEPATCPQCGRPQSATGQAATGQAETGQAETGQAETLAPSELTALQTQSEHDRLAARYGPSPSTAPTEPTASPTREPAVISAPPFEGARQNEPRLFSSDGAPTLASEYTSGPSDSGSKTEGTPFAPYFTIQTRLIFGPASTSALLRQPTVGSLSFGPEGFAIVSDEGRQWEKIRYHDLSSVRRQDDSVHLILRDVESRLTLYHPWLPDWIAEPRRRRAATVAELLSRVRAGLTPYEISLSRRRLS